MKLPLSSIQKTKVGSCPHGLPHGACPVCSGMGGGSAAAKKNEKPAGEMTWDECYAVWQQMLKAKELAQQKRNDMPQAQMHPQVNFSAGLENIAQKITVITQKLSDFIRKNQENSSITSKILTITAKIAVPVLNVIKNIPLFTQKIINFVQEKLADISDKLNAIFGELKNSIEKKISEKLRNFKKRFKSIFNIFEPDEIQDEEKKIEEDKRIFEMKTLFNSINGELLKRED